ncbi:MAG: flagellar biosynthesis protein FlhF [Gammaproteobacteria bacterium]|nr:MAG: flagellar biosynthesis protein FlhF [Pseudomonadota bacterium]PIE38091.1 MAG: flagellar biosynthesis protein FlhF [Gammaproteobacteria bacterium]
MNVKKFFAPTMQEALRQVREAVGADAVILSNKKVEGGIEVVAATDYDEQKMLSDYSGRLSGEPPTPGQLARMQAERHLELEQQKQKSRARISSITHPGGERANHKSRETLVDNLENRFLASSRQIRSSGKAVVHEPVQSSKGNDDENTAVLNEMKSQILQLQDMLKQQITETEKKTSAVYRELKDRLCLMGLDASFQEALLQRVVKEKELAVAWRQVLGDIASQCLVEEQEVIDQTGCLAFFGPTGAGKTTTIGKLATRTVLRYGARNVALVTTDRYRIAAHEQLRVFGRILDVPVSVVDEENSLNDVLDKLRDKKLVLIDTAGLNQNCADWHAQIAEFTECKYRIRNYLVIPATSQLQIIKSSFHAHEPVGLQGCIVTKTDEAISLGEVIGFLCNERLPVSYITDGQKIPDDIHPASPALLVGKAVSLLQDLALESNKGLSNCHTGS